MNDLLTPDEVEDRLRRTLATRAEWMAPGDGVDSDPAVAAAVPLVPLRRELPAPDGRDHRRMLVLAAAATLTVAGLAGATLLSSGGRSTPDASDRSSTAAGGGPATGPGGQQLATCEEWTVEFRPPDELAPPMRVPRGDGNRAYVSLQVATEPMDPSWADQLDIVVYDGTPAPADELDEPIDVGGRPGLYRAMPGAIGHLGGVRFAYDEKTVVVEARQVSKADLLRVAASVARNGDGTWSYEVLPGYEDHCGGL